MELVLLTYKGEKNNGTQHTIINQSVNDILFVNTCAIYLVYGYVYFLIQSYFILRKNINISCMIFFTFKDLKFLVRFIDL